ncbi:GPW/gp25 family protein [Azospirillum doebereinerae]|uniref:GPW/gp25 family protein n=1 Tax=Azospirillum doebereinerae TaxID=92933 RepID=UPI001EE54632|nr:GPW/gp25 family protein [Azospirillum doebereinerae]MCG5240094.1 GPW/gp25 family protein [Azospirillum doebereinerae]
MDASTGAALVGLGHLRQSIRDILTTRVGTRVARRAYGSELPALVDAPMNPALAVDLYAATAKALARWEPRIRLHRIAIASAAPGRVALQLVALYLPEGREITLDGIVIE